MVRFYYVKIIKPTESNHLEERLRQQQPKKGEISTAVVHFTAIKTIVLAT